MQYRERLTVPASWWGIALFFVVSFVAAVAFWIGPEVSLVAAGAACLVVAAALTWIGRTQVVVDGRGLTAGSSLLEWEWLGEVVVHDRTQTRNRLGREADHRAHLVFRGYIPTSIEVAVADSDDPHPYWLVSTRRPRALAAAIAAGRGEV